jgi:hypothetical protein
MPLFSINVRLDLSPAVAQDLKRIAVATERQAISFEELLVKLNEDGTTVDPEQLGALGGAVDGQAVAAEQLQEALDSAPKST